MWKEISMAAAVAACLAAPAAAEPLTLRLNDATAEPGGLAALVLRTYAPRGVEQGHLCVRAKPRTKAALTSSPFVDLEDVVVFSDAGDAASSSVFDAATQTADVDFTSASGTVNGSDGPLAVFFFRLHNALAGGEEFDLEIDLGATVLIEAGGGSIPLELRAGVLTIRSAGAPQQLAAEGDEVAPGSVAVLGVETREPFAVGGGQAAFTYDPAFAAGPPVVAMDPRYGDSTFTTDTSVAGRVVVTFQSPGGTLNTVPGAFISIDLPTSAALPPGSVSTVALDPSATYLEDPQGQAIPVELAEGVLELASEGWIFGDGFESGDVTGWSSVIR